MHTTIAVIRQPYDQLFHEWWTKVIALVTGPATTFWANTQTDIARKVTSINFQDDQFKAAFRILNLFSTNRGWLLIMAITGMLLWSILPESN
jgi:hypothetical protein